jgi:hypothetical protein
VHSISFRYSFKKANPIDNLHAVFAMCGITDEATRANIIVQEGFTQLEDLGVLKNDIRK